MTSELRTPASAGAILDDATEERIVEDGRASLGTLARLYRVVGHGEAAAQIEGVLDDGAPHSWRFSA